MKILCLTVDSLHSSYCVQSTTVQEVTSTSTQKKKTHTQFCNIFSIFRVWVDIATLLSTSEKCSFTDYESLEYTKKSFFTILI